MDWPDILRRLGRQDIPRLRFGIGAAPPEWDVADYVISKFRKDEWEIVDRAVGKAADAVAVWVTEGMAACMNRFNAAPAKKKKKKQESQKSQSEAEPSPATESSVGDNEDTFKPKSDTANENKES